MGLAGRLLELIVRQVDLSVLILVVAGIVLWLFFRRYLVLIALLIVLVMVIHKCWPRIVGAMDDFFDGSSEGASGSVVCILSTSPSYFGQPCMYLFNVDVSRVCNG